MSPDDTPPWSCASLVLVQVLELLDATPGLPKVTPVFISLDPNRDSLTQMKHYQQGAWWCLGVPRTRGRWGTGSRVGRGSLLSPGPDPCALALCIVVAACRLPPPHAVFDRHPGPSCGCCQEVPRVLHCS